MNSRSTAAVVAAVEVPVTLKIRTGYSRTERNAVRIARIAEASGIAAIAVHGRTREDFFTGEAEYDSAAAVKSAVAIPVIVNGDLDSPEKAAAVLRASGCDGLMLGRSALGRPWIFREMAHFLATGRHLPPPAARQEAERGTYDPTYGGYFLGKLALLKLRADVQAARGPAFNSFQ